MYTNIVQHLLEKKSLTSEEISFFFQKSIEGKCTESQKAAVLSLLQAKGVSAEELTAFAELLLSEAPVSLNFQNAVDICGTGGSGLSRINTSTISAFVLAALGIPIAKHGNRAASGRFGSFDLLEKLGINIEVSSEISSYAFWKENLSFLFARSFHPVMRHFVAVRQELGFPTLFNILGPLISPVHAKYQVIGTAFESQMELMAQTAKNLQKETVLVVRGEDGLDEITLTGLTKVIEMQKKSALRTYDIHPSDFGITTASFKKIAGGSAKENTDMAKHILKGTCTTRHRDLVLINAAFTLYSFQDVSEGIPSVDTLKEAYKVVKEVLESGKAYEKFCAYREISTSKNVLYEIVGNRYQDLLTNPPKQSSLKKGNTKKQGFLKTLSRPGLHVIAEVKKKSPSKGTLAKSDVNIVEIAQKYEQSGASAISVLTESKYFGGSLKDLRKVSEAVSIPVLRKDFILHESQIEEAKAFGASAVLLIAAILSEDQINSFLKVAKKLELDCLVEVHTKEELEKVWNTEAEIIGINNRDLTTLDIDLKTTTMLMQQIQSLQQSSPIKKKNLIIISESGISDEKDVQTLPRNIRGILVGTSLMKEKNPEKKIQTFLAARKLLKVCGVRTIAIAKFCEKEGVNIIGLNFVPRSKRRVSLEQAKKIRPAVMQTKAVGVFEDQSLEEVNTIAEELNLDFIQLSGKEDLSFVQQCCRPVIKTISLETSKDIDRARTFLPSCSFLLFDSKEPGSGQLSRYELLKHVDFPYLLAGGIYPGNIQDILKEVDPLGVDMASGVEEEGSVSSEKIERLMRVL